MAPIDLTIGRPRRRDERGPWYSGDLSYATDLHPFWLTQSFYECVLDAHPEFNWIREFIPIICGSRNLILDDAAVPEPPATPDIPELFLPWNQARTLAWARSRQAARPTLGTESLTKLKEFHADYLTFIQDCIRLPGDRTTQGAMMGSASSWPLLPLVTHFAHEKAGIRRFRTRGDDFLTPDMTRERKAVVEHELGRLGGVLSLADPEKGKPNKIFENEVLGLFAETPYHNGKEIPIFPVSSWAAPPGGSKGTLNWATQPQAIMALAREMHAEVPPLWKASPFYHTWRLAYKRGLPLGAEAGEGGIDHPAFPRRASGRISGTDVSRFHAWLSYMAQLSTAQWALGSGLAILPSPNSGETMEWGKAWFNAVQRDPKLKETYVSALPIDKDHNVLPDIREATLVITSALSSWEMYTRPPPNVCHTPSVKIAQERFDRKLRRVRVWYAAEASYASLKEDVIRKSSRWVHLKAVEGIRKRSRPSYGVAPSKGSTDVRHFPLHPEGDV